MSQRQAPTRREALGTFAATALVGALPIASTSRAKAGPEYQLATFEVDVTVPIGHPLMGGGVEPAKEVVDPLLLRGVVLLGPDRPIVLAAIDWCEIRNEAYNRWREVIAQAAGTDPGRVLLSSIHQHDAPVADLEAERILQRNHCAGSVCDLEFHEKAVQAGGQAVQEALGETRPITHLGLGSAIVEQVASNRRYLAPDGTPRFDRGSATRDPYARQQPEETIDPVLRTISFWDNDQPIAALSAYAVHPMSYYGQGGVSADFTGLARRRRQEADPSVFSIYVSGCSGNVTAGKFNDGSPENRAVLADRIERAMNEAWQSTRRHLLNQVQFRSVPLRLEPRDGEGFTVDDLKARLAQDQRPFDQCLAALGLSWRTRADAGATIEVPAIDFGPACWLLLPGETYVEYQLLAQRLRPDAFVVVAGYGECATGYIPTEQAFAEEDTNLRDWCWVSPGAEAAMTEAIRKALT